MSSILKALKKLEEEKTARTPHSLNIDAEILKGDRRSTFSAGRTVAALALFACGAGVTYYMMRHGAMPPAAPQPQSQVSAPSPMEGAAEKQPSAPHVPPVRPSSAPVAAENHPPAASAVPLKNVKTPARNVPAPPTRQIKTAGTDAPPSVLKVNGIAVQDEAADSVAVVNGQSVSVGGLVNGARVEAIMKDRVKFSRNGKTFEVTLGTTSP